MKKYKLFLFSILFLFLTSFAFTQITGDLSISKNTNNNTCKAFLKIGYDFNISSLHIIPYTSIENYFYLSTNENNYISGNPFRDLYSLGLLTSIKLTTSTIYVQLQHTCQHEISFQNVNNRPILNDLAIPNTSDTYLTIGYKFGYFAE